MLSKSNARTEAINAARASTVGKPGEMKTGKSNDIFINLSCPSVYGLRKQARVTFSPSVYQISTNDAAPARGQATFAVTDDASKTMEYFSEKFCKQIDISKLLKDNGYALSNVTYTSAIAPTARREEPHWTLMWKAAPNQVSMSYKTKLGNYKQLRMPNKGSNGDLTLIREGSRTGGQVELIHRNALCTLAFVPYRVRVVRGEEEAVKAVLEFRLLSLQAHNDGSDYQPLMISMEDAVDIDVNGLISLDASDDEEEDDVPSADKFKPSKKSKSTASNGEKKSRKRKAKDEGTAEEEMEELVADAENKRIKVEDDGEEEQAAQEYGPDEDAVLKALEER